MKHIIVITALLSPLASATETVCVTENNRTVCTTQDSGMDRWDAFKQELDNDLDDNAAERRQSSRDRMNNQRNYLNLSPSTFGGQPIGYDQFGQPIYR